MRQRLLPCFSCIVAPLNSRFEINSTAKTLSRRAVRRFESLRLTSMMNRSFNNVYQPKQVAKTLSIDSLNGQGKKPYSLNWPRAAMIEICKYCVEYVNAERFILNENSYVGGGLSSLLRPISGLANPNAPNTLPSLVHDVRNLVDTMANVESSAYTRILREYDTQPQVILAAAFHCLRFMESSLWNEVYDDVLSTADNATEDYNETKNFICEWMTALSSTEFELTKSLFKFLNRYLTAKLKISSSPNASDLAAVMSGFVCKPQKSAYLSIRHVEDLRRIRPIVSFIIERFPDIFTKDLKPVPKPSPQTESPAGTLSRDSSGSVFAKGSPSSPMSSRKTFHIPSLIMTPDGLSRDSSTSNLASFLPGYSSDEVVSQSIPETSRSWSSLNITRWELKILETIVQHVSVSYLKRTADYLRKSPMHSPYTSMASPEQSPNEYFSDDDTVLKSHFKELAVTAGVYSYHSSSSPTSKDSPYGSSGSDSHTIKHMNAFESSPRFQEAKRWSTKREHGLRRRMISECKTVRNQIMQFEQEWIRKHGRDPKTSERGSMQAVYTSYRDMKRTIRDISAIDIQRFARSYMVRVKLKKAKLNLNIKDENSDHNRRAFGPVLSESSSSRASSNLPELLQKYRDLQAQKKDVKRQLKKFDEDFVLANGRQPKKSDKEVMRPMYQNYHDIKARVDELKKSIESQNGGIPIDEGKEEADASYLVRMGSHDSSNGDDGDENDDKFEIGKRSPSKQWSLSLGGKVEKPVILRSKSDGTIDTARSEDSVLTTHSLPETQSIDKDRQLSALTEEKKNLHAYLKAYERDFNQTHGRPVMKEEDIQPVANEYQRYKELKLLIKESKIGK